MGTMMGKLKGTMEATMPTGSRTSEHVTPRETCSVLPWASWGRLHAHSTVSFPLATDANASPLFLPFSRTTSSASSSACVSNRCWKRNMMLARAFTVSPLHATKACWAWVTASSTSAAFETQTLPMVVPSTGDTTGK